MSVGSWYFFRPRVSLCVARSPRFSAQNRGVHLIRPLSLSQPSLWVCGLVSQEAYLSENLTGDIVVRLPEAHDVTFSPLLTVELGDQRPYPHSIWFRPPLRCFR